jgi:hypothetical protein
MFYHLKDERMLEFLIKIAFSLLPILGKDFLLRQMEESFSCTCIGLVISPRGPSATKSRDTVVKIFSLI